MDNGLDSVESLKEGLSEGDDVIKEYDDQKISDDIDNVENEEAPIRSKCMGVLV